MAKAELYRAYEDWCTETGFQGMAAATFYERVHAAAVDVYGTPLREAKRQGTRGLRGLRLATPTDHGAAGGTRGSEPADASHLQYTRERMLESAPSAPSAPTVRTGEAAVDAQSEVETAAVTNDISTLDPAAALVQELIESRARRGGRHIDLLAELNLN